MIATICTELSQINIDKRKINNYNRRMKKKMVKPLQNETKKK